MQLPISVIIPTMNRPESLERTLKFMTEGNDVPHQVIIVDQSQKEEVRIKNQEVLKKYITWIESQVYIYQNIPSLTKARNLGLSKATNEILVFADDDIDVNIDTLTNVVEVMKNDKIAMIAGIDELTQQSSSDIGYLLGTKSFYKRKIGHVTYSMLGRYPDKIQQQIETQWAQGYFFVVRNSLIKKWNCKWDENLTSYAYAEDLDFSYGYYKRAYADGLRCVIDPKIKVKHLATLEYRIPGEKNIYMYVLNRVYLRHKHKMGIYGCMASAWCNWWRLVQSVVTRQRPTVFVHALWCSLKYRKDIYAGNLDYEKMMNS